MPAGVNGNYTGGVFTISGTTTASGTFNFTVTTTGGCAPDNTAVGTITVNPTPNVTATNASQTICSGTAITTMVLSGNVVSTTFNWTRDNAADVTGIAATGSGNISGTLTNTSNTPATVTFTITPTANGCDGTPITTTVLVKPIPNAVATNASQTICSATPITTMALSGSVASTTFNWTRNNTVAVTGIAASGAGNISGTLTNTTTAPVTVTFTITPTANGCTGASITATVLVNPTPNAVATNTSQTICSGTAITTMALSGNIASTTFNWTRNNTGTVTGIAASGSGNISGTLTNTTSASITVTFIITPTANGCNGTPITTTVVVKPTPNAMATNSSQTICNATPMATMTLSGSVASTNFSWTRDNSVAVTGIAASGTGNISGTLTNTTNAPVTVTFTITPTANGCTGASITASVLVQPTTIGGAVTISQPTVTPVVKTATECHTATGILYLSGHIGNVVRWESSTNAGATWTPIANTATIYNYNGLTQTTMFRAVINNEPNCLVAYSTFSMINIIPNLRPTNVIATPAAICEGSSSVLSSTSSYTNTSSALAAGGSFSGANPPGWYVDGCDSCLSSGGSNDVPGPWQLSSSNGKNYSGVDYTSIGKFSIAHGEGIVSYMYTPIFNTFGLENATLTFRHAYKFYTGARGEVQISADGGTTYTTIQTYTGTLTPTDPFTAAANSVSIDLNAYLGQGNLKIRFYYYGVDTVAGNPNGSSWAIDDIAIPDVPTTVSTQWVDAVTGQTISNNMTMTVTPTVTTTYAITSYINGCNSFGTEGTEYITVTVNPRPTAVISQNQTVCAGSSVNLTVNFTGTAPWNITYSNGSTSTTVNGITANPYTITIPSITATRTYTITALSDSKCTALASGFAGSATITVNPRPTAVLGPNQNICPGGTPNNLPITFTGTGPWNITYSNGSTFTTVNNINTNPYIITIPNNGVTTTYTVTALSDSKCTANASDFVGSTTIAFNPRPTAVLGTDQAVCRGSSASLTVNFTGTAPWNITYSNGSTLTTVTNINANPYTIIIPNITAAATYTLTALSDSKCTANASDITGSATVTVNERPTAVIGTNQAVCPGTAVNLSVNFTGTGPWNITYSNGSTSTTVNGITANPYTITTPTLTSTTTYTLTAVSDSKCAAIASGITGPAVVTVNPRPTAVLSGSQTVCPGTSVNLTINFTGTGPWNITYSNGSTSTTVNNITADPYTLTIPNVTATATYTLTAVSDSKCTANASDITGSATVTVRRPTAVIATNQTICSGNSVSLTVTFTGNKPYIMTYSNGSTSTTVNVDANSYTFTTPVLTSTTTYTITALSDKFCTAIPVDFASSATITVNKPTAVLGTSQYVCSGNSANLTVNFTGTGPWNITYSNGSTSTTVNGITANPYTITIPNVTATRTYTLTALSASGCNAPASDISGSATLTVLNGTTPGLWTGLVSTDWFDCKNWAGGLPSASIDAQIPNGITRMPVIDPLSPYAAAYNYIASARDVIINTSASISMNANSNLEVKRDWKNSGSFIPGTGTVTFNGATSNQVQLINSGIKLNEAFYNLTLNCTNGAKGINVPDSFELTVANNLVLTSGDLRLTGEAQLVQNGTSANPSGGTGVLLRDQQGTKSSYHYNYWSSPVSADNLSYTVGGVLKDGTNAAGSPFSQNPINFGSGYYFSDGPLTNPIKISNSWIYKYTLISTSYYSWQLIGSTGSVKVGEGYTMKGVTGLEPNTNYQNYTFVGKPNNGTISLTMAPNQLYLIGNPYPSAIDADEFIKDNILDNGRATSNVFNGALYFWDHFGAQTHTLGQYIGGYATYNLMGGVVATSSDPMINNNMASGSKVPKRYIPVAQGFFIRTDLAGATNMINPISGGTVTFKNSQRAFKTESSSNSLFIRNENLTVGSGIDNRQKIRLSFEAPSGLHRQLLVGADPSTTNFFDLGYDAPMIDLNPDDMYWNFSEAKFVIQGIPDFNIDQVIPLAFKISSAGTTKIKIDELENIPASTEIYLFDSVTGLYHDIKNEDFVADFPTGEYTDRFALRFTTETLSSDDVTRNNGIMVFADANHFLNIKNNFTDNIVEAVQLYNILGQSIAKWNVADEEQRNIKIPVEHIRTGTYIVKLKTSNGSLSKKVIIR